MALSVSSSVSSPNSGCWIILRTNFVGIKFIHLCLGLINQLCLIVAHRWNIKPSFVLFFINCPVLCVVFGQVIKKWRKNLTECLRVDVSSQKFQKINIAEAQAKKQSPNIARYRIHPPTKKFFPTWRYNHWNPRNNREYHWHRSRCG